MDGLPEDEVEVESWTSRYFWDFPLSSHQPLFIAEKEEILKKNKRIDKGVERKPLHLEPLNKFTLFFYAKASLGASHVV